MAHSRLPSYAAASKVKRCIAAATCVTSISVIISQSYAKTRTDMNANDETRLESENH